MTKNEFLAIVNTLDHFTVYGETILIEDFAGFDPDWNEVMNDIDHDLIREVETLARRLDLKVEYTSRGI